jgi:hypothetical protein
MVTTAHQYASTIPLDIGGGEPQGVFVIPFDPPDQVGHDGQAHKKQYDGQPNDPEHGVPDGSDLAQGFISDRDHQAGFKKRLGKIDPFFPFRCDGNAGKAHIANPRLHGPQQVWDTVKHDELGVQLVFFTDDIGDIDAKALEILENKGGKFLNGDFNLFGSYRRRN